MKTLSLTAHQITPISHFCSCGQDTVTCQGCGKQICGSSAVWLDRLPGSNIGGNLGTCCLPTPTERIESLERKYKWARDSRERWMQLADKHEQLIHDVTQMVKTLRAEFPLNGSTAQELDKIVNKLEGE